MKIAILDDWLNCAKDCADWSSLDTGISIDVFQDTVTGRSLVNRLRSYDILCLMRERTPIDDSLMAQLPKLRAIITSGMRNASIDLEAARQRGIVVCGTGSPGHATAELAFILIGMLARQILPGANSMRDGGWQTHLGRDLRHARLGILGLGRLGGELAGFAKAFGMDVQAWSQNLTEERCTEVGVTYVDRETLFKTSDFISVHLKLSDRVRHLVGAAEMAMMKQDACLVNTSRAAIIDMDALQAALAVGQIGGAAVDVYDMEPVPANAVIRQTPNLLMTPHIGYVTRETMRVFYQGTLEAIKAIHAGAPIRTL